MKDNVNLAAYDAALEELRAAKAQVELILAELSGNATPDGDRMVDAQKRFERAKQALDRIGSNA